MKRKKSLMSPFRTTWFYVLLLALLFIIIAAILLLVYAKNGKIRILDIAMIMYYLAIIFFIIGCIIYVISYYLSSNIDRSLRDVTKCSSKCIPICNSTVNLNYECVPPVVAAVNLGEEPAKTPKCVIIDGKTRMPLSSFAKYL